MKSITIESTASGFSGTSPASPITLSMTCQGTNRLLIVMVAHESPTGDITGITFDGVAMTELRVETGSSNQIHEIWYLVAPNVTTANISVAFGGVLTQAHITGICLGGAKQSAPTVTVGDQAAGGSETNPTITITPTAFDGIILLGFTSTEGTTYTVATPLSQLVNGSSSFIGALAGFKRYKTVDIFSLGWTATASNWAGNAVVVEPAGDTSPSDLTNKTRPRAFAPGIAR